MGGRTAIRASLLAIVPDIPDIEQRITEQEALYSAFCVAKHGNPKALRGFGLTISGTTARLYHGPFAAPYIVRQGQFALYHSARMVALARMVFAKPLLSRVSADARQRYERREHRVANRIIHISQMLPGSRTLSDFAPIGRISRRATDETF